MSETTAPAPAWRQLYQAVMAENDHNKLTHLVGSLEEAIVARVQSLGDSQNPADVAERDELHHAAHDLLEVNTKKLGWPDMDDKIKRGNEL